MKPDSCAPSIRLRQGAVPRRRVNTASLVVIYSGASDNSGQPWPLFPFSSKRMPFSRDPQCLVRRRPVASGLVVLLIGVLAVPLGAGEKRSRPPQFDADAFRGVFYSDVRSAVQADRPSAPELRGTASANAKTATQRMANATDAASSPAKAGGEWSQVISSTSLEDEIKRLKLQYDSVVTTPGAFRSGGFQDARRQLSVLAMLFGVISQYDGDVRWKSEAATARDLLARTAFNSKAGSVQVYNEAKLRKADLQDLVSGARLNGRDAEAEVDWPSIVDRAPLMEYLEVVLYDHLDQLSRNPAEIDENKATLQRFAELVAVVGHVLVKEGMPEADDEDYRQLSSAMIEAALNVRAGLEQEDPDTVGIAISEISQSCDSCHEQYR